MIRKICLICLMIAAGCEQRDDAASRSGAVRPVTVFAASSLREVVTDVAAEWSRRTGRLLRTQFEATSTLARQIREGAGADVFLTAAPEWLEDSSLIDRRDWLSNRLVLVVRQHAAAPDMNALPSLALANAQVPAGKYAQAALRHMHISLPERVLYGDNVRDVLAKVAEGGAAAGIVYATDTLIDPRVRVVFEFPPDSHEPIVYSAGLLTTDGGAFFHALSESWALELARGHGFTVLKP